MSTLTAAIDTERNEGRFKLGNKGGPGNPFAGKVALLRKAILEIITPKDIQDIVESLIDLAIEGNLHAAKLILSYAIGKPEWMDRITIRDEGFTAPPSTNGDFQEEPSPNGNLQELTPSPNGIFSPLPLGEGLGVRAEQCLTPSTNGILHDEPSPNGVFEESMPSPNGDAASPLNRKQRRALRKARREAKRQRNSPKPAPQPVPSAS